MFDNMDNERFQEALDELKNKVLDLSEKASEIPGKLSTATEAGREKLKQVSEVLGIDKGIAKGKEAISGIYQRVTSTSEAPKELLDLYHQLDEEDRAIIRGEMRAMLRDAKYNK